MRVVDQAYFLSYYKEIQHFHNHKLMFNVNIDGTERIMGVRHGINNTQIIFYVWHEDMNSFIIDTCKYAMACGFKILFCIFLFAALPQLNIHQRVTYVKTVDFYNENSHLYVETYNAESKLNLLESAMKFML